MSSPINVSVAAKKARGIYPSGSTVTRHTASSTRVTTHPISLESQFALRLNMICENI